ncbi:MAG TPA: lamin tail domain-containing protein [Gaiellaceae bacterium]
MRFGRIVLGLLTLAVALACAASTLASASGVVISEFRFRGPAGGNDEFVELVNAGSASVDVSGWRLQGCASASGAASARVTIPGGVTLAPGDHYLIVNNNASGGYSGTVPGDLTYGTGFSDGSGARITLADGTTVVDGVGGDGVGGTQCREGAGIANMPTANGDQSYERKNGTQDTDDNASDFTGPKTSNPQNHSGADAAPAVTATSPADGAAVDANVAVTFSEPVTVSGSWFTISCTKSGSHDATVSGGPTTFTLDPTADFVTAESCTVTVVAAGVSDVDTNDPPDHPTADSSFTFSTEGPPVRIHEIQGAGHVSPLANRTVSRVPGIVTQKVSNGFFLQDPDPDSDPNTSEGIFVFGSISAGQVAVGDSVLVNGRVQEFHGAATDLGNTEIASPSVTIVSHGNALPAPVVLSPPTQVIEDDATGNVETTGTFDPASDGIDYYESLEEMRVEIDDAVATGPSHDFPSSSTSEVSVVGAGAGVRTPHGGVVIAPDDFNPERIILQTAIGGLGQVNTGDKIPGATVGALDYNFGNFKLRPAGPVNVVSGGLQPETTTAAGTDQLAVATFNVENLDPTDGAAKFDRLAGILVHNLASPDLVALEEVQDNNGATDDGTVDASVTLDTLVAAIQSAGGPHYEYRLVNPVNDQDGGEPGGNIRVAFLFRSDRGLAFVDRPGADSTTANAVVGTGADTHLQFSPGRVDPASAAWTDSRKPLAGEFTYQGHKLFVIANHFNSKGGDDPLFGRFQPPVNSSEAQRHQQATEVHDFVGQLLTADPAANVVVLGDLNDFEFSETVSILKSAGLHALVETLPKPERYTYDFDGNSQAIDHTLLSGNLFDHSGFAYDIVHVNAEFADQASDHDPQVVHLNLARPTIVGSRQPAANANGWNNTAVTVSFTCTDPLAALVSCPAPVTVSTEGANQSVTGSSDLKGGGSPISATVSGISIDTTPPSIVFSGNKGTYGVDETVAIHCAASDTLSGLASSTCPEASGPAYTFALGTHTLRASAIDRAGNKQTATATFRITVDRVSLCALTRQFESKASVANQLCNRLERGQVLAYALEVAAQTGKTLTIKEAAVLVRLALAL